MAELRHVQPIHVAAYVEQCGSCENDIDKVHGLPYTPVPKERRRETLSHFAHSAHGPLFESLGPQACIAACRITVAVLSAFGITARAVPVKLLAGLPHSDIGVHLGSNPAEIAANYGLRPQMFDHRGWNGHLVVLAEDVDEQYWLIDPTLDQVFTRLSSEGHQVKYPPKVEVFSLGKENFLNRAKWRHEFETECGQLFFVEYKGSRDSSYRSHPSWSFAPLQLVAENIYESLRDQ